MHRGDLYVLQLVVCGCVSVMGEGGGGGWAWACALGWGVIGALLVDGVACVL